MSNSLVIRTSNSSVTEATRQLKQALDERKIKLFAHIDHQAAAAESGLQLNEEQVLVFGDPGVGTKLMQERSEIGIELPLKILIWNDGGVTKVAYRDPLAYLAEFNIVSNRQVIEKMSSLMANLTQLVANG